MLADFFEVHASEWTEMIAAAAFLEGKDPACEMFDPEVADGLRVLLRCLSAIPYTWAREICFEVQRQAQ